MSIKDKAAGIINKGTAMAGRVSRQQTIKAELKAISNKKSELFEALGKEVYSTFNANAQIREPLDSLFKSIESLELQEQVLQIDLSAISDELNRADDSMRSCSSCGKPVSPNQAYCVFCGSEAETQGPAQPLKCKTCGEPLVEGQKYCIRCGAET